MEKVTVPASAGRLINAVANMGYDPEVALCDLIDNSIDANAHNIKIHLTTQKPEKGRKEVISRCLIADDGNGMDRETLINAFTLGSQRSYPKHALGKFGIGLKSASLSLSSKIIMLTKTKNADKPLCAVLSRQDIESSGKYEIDLGDDPTEQYKLLWQEYAPSQTQESMLILEELNSPPNEDFIDYLQRYCGVIYHLFLEDNSKPLVISVNDEEITPLDPLFRKEAEKGGSLDVNTWDGKTCHVLLEHTELALDDGHKCYIAATNLVHPPTFGAEDHALRKQKRIEYNIEVDPYNKRPTHGFYIYRNNRVIVLAELFRGLISRETSAWAFRGRLMFDESADTVLSLDVKKRHCVLPPIARETLGQMIGVYHNKSIKAWKKRGELVISEKQKAKDQIASKSIAETVVTNTDYIPASAYNLNNPQQIEKRQERQEEIRKEVLSNIQDAELTEEVLEIAAKQKDVIKKARGLKGNLMWEAYPSSAHKLVEVIINEHHNWISCVEEASKDDARITLLVNQLFTIIGRAELEVRTTHNGGISKDELDKVFKEFRRCASEIAERLADDLPKELAELAQQELSAKE